MNVRTRGQLVGLVALSVALVVGACASADNESIAMTSIDTAPAASTTTVGEGADRRAASTQAEPAEPVMSETLEPAGSVEGGNVERVYVGDEYPPELDAIIASMVADLAEGRAIDVQQIRIATVEEVTWSDGSLGCPQPGMVYGQVVTDGMRVVLEADGVFYDYRSDGIHDPVLCEKAPVTEKSSAALLELTDEGVVRIDPPSTDGSLPINDSSPPDQ